MTTRVVIVGASGWAGKRHVNAFTQVGATIVGIVDPSSTTAAIAAQCGARVITELHEITPDNTDLVVVALPVEIQASVVTQLLGQGCRVLCEKPVAVDTDEIRELRSLPEASERLTVGYMLRSHPAAEHLYQWCQKVEVLAVKIRTSAHKAVIDGWRSTASSGGVITVNAVHALDYLGMITASSPATVVTAWSSSRLYGSSAAELVHASLLTDSGVHVQLEASWTPWPNDIGINGVDFDLSIDVVAKQGRRHWHNWELNCWEPEGAVWTDRYLATDLFVNQAKKALEFARGSGPNVSIEDSLYPSALASSINDKIRGQL